MKPTWMVENADDDAVLTALALARLNPEAQMVVAGPHPIPPLLQEALHEQGIPSYPQFRQGPAAQRALLDVWTSPLDARVLQLRSQGVLASCLADWILERYGSRTLGITGTAGKTTTSWLLAQLLPALGAAACSSQARAANLWPTSRLLEAASQREGDWLVAELTSSHLAFCHHSPHVAAITNFWPDHLELHGGLEAYRAAKARLFQFQQSHDIAVLPAHDREAIEVAAASPAQRAWWSPRECPERSSDPLQVWTSGSGELHIRSPHFVQQLSLPDGLRDDPVLLEALLCALTVALAVHPYPKPGRLEGALEQLQFPPHRGRHRPQARLIDETLAATPRKAAARLTPGTQLVAGGMLEVAGRRVHEAPEEQPNLSLWLQAIAQNCASLDLFGSAGGWIFEALQDPPMSFPVTLHPGLEAALEAALRRPGSVRVAPGFPMLQSDRDWVAALSASLPLQTG